MLTLSQKDSASTQDVGSSCQDGLEAECPRKPDLKQSKIYGVGDPTTILSSESSCLSSRGRVVKWFWDSAEEGYRTFHMDEYDEDRNPSVSADPKEGIAGREPSLTLRAAPNLYLSGWSHGPLTPNGLLR
jgi:hypothetical protein